MNGCARSACAFELIQQKIAMTMASPKRKIDCSAQPLDFSFHSENPNILAAGLVDGTVESMYTVFLAYIASVE